MTIRRLTLWIAGASGQLGAAVAAHFEAAGHTVVRLSSGPVADPTREIEARFDAPDAVERLRAAAAALPPDAVICTIGAWAGGQPLVATTEATFDRMFAANVRVPWVLARGVLPALQARRGALAFITSQAAHGPAPGQAAYGAAKAAMHSLALSLRAECAATGVAVHTIAPGTLDTAANRAAMPDADPTGWVAPAALCAALEALLTTSFAPGGADLNLLAR